MLVWVAAGLLALVILSLAGSLLIKWHVEKRWPPVGQFVTIDGMQIHYVDVNSSTSTDVANPPIVFLHGANSNLRDQMAPLRPLFEDSHRLIFVDRPGYGHSTRLNQDYSDPALQCQVISGLLDHLAIDRAIICGHSLGCAVSVAFGVFHPQKTAGLMFLAPATHPWPSGVEWYYKLANVPILGLIFSYCFAPIIGWIKYPSAIASVFAPNEVPDNYAQISGTRSALRGAQFFDCAQDIFHLNSNVSKLVHRYREIKVPTVIITGDRDDIVMADIHSDGLARDIEGAELIVLPDLGHKPDYFAHEEIVAGMSRISAAARQERV